MLRRTFLAAGGASLLAACSAPRAAPDAAAEMAFPPIGPIVGDPGRRVHVAAMGPEDAPPVILLHGASGNVRDWTFDIMPRLAARYRVVAMDRPGFGYSERSAGEEMWCPFAQAAQLRAAADALGLQRPLLVGHSWGAAVALAWAQDAQENVRGVVSVSGVTMPWGGIVPALDAIGFGGVIAGLYTRRISRTAESGGIERFISRAFRPQTPPPGYLAHVGAPLALREKTLAANAEDLAHTNPAIKAVAARYDSLMTPVEILHGDEDWLLDVAQHGISFAKAAPNARLTVLPGIGHMAHHARPDALEAALARLV